MDLKILSILALIWGFNISNIVQGARRGQDNGVFEGEGCDKMPYIKSDFDCPSPGIFAITRNCVDYIICAPNAFNEYDDFFTSCELPYQYYVGNGQCINATIAGNERENCPQMDCKIVPAGAAPTIPQSGSGGVSQQNNERNAGSNNVDNIENRMLSCVLLYIVFVCN